MKTQVFECFTAEAAAGQKIRLFEMQVPKTESMQMISFKGVTQGGTPWAAFW